MGEAGGTGVGLAGGNFLSRDRGNGRRLLSSSSLTACCTRGRTAWLAFSGGKINIILSAGMCHPLLAGGVLSPSHHHFTQNIKTLLPQSICASPSSCLLCDTTPYTARLFACWTGLLVVHTCGLLPLLPSVPSLSSQTFIAISGQACCSASFFPLLPSFFSPTTTHGIFLCHPSPTPIPQTFYSVPTPNLCPSCPSLPHLLLLPSFPPAHPLPKHTFV